MHRQSRRSDADRGYRDDHRDKGGGRHRHSEEEPYGDSSRARERGAGRSGLDDQQAWPAASDPASIGKLLSLTDFCRSPWAWL